jgi:hypothetical protein
MILLRTTATLLHLLANDIVAKIDALVANEYRRACDQLANLVLALATEGAVQQLAAIVARFGGFIAHPVVLRPKMCPFHYQTVPR